MVPRWFDGLDDRDGWAAGVPKAPSPLRFAGALHGQEANGRFRLAAGAGD